MPVKPGDPLKKITLNLYTADCQWFAKVYGRGWSEHVRELMRKHRVQKAQAEDILEIVNGK